MQNNTLSTLTLEVQAPNLGYYYSAKIRVRLYPGSHPRTDPPP